MEIDSLVYARIQELRALQLYEFWRNKRILAMCKLNFANIEIKSSHNFSIIYSDFVPFPRFNINEINNSNNINNIEIDEGDE